MPLAVPNWTKEVWDDAFIDYVKAQRELDVEIKRVLSSAARDANNILARLEGVEGVGAAARRAQVQTSLRLLDGVNQGMWDAIGPSIGDALWEASDIAIEAQSEMLSQLITMGVSRSAASELAQGFTAAARNAVENMQSRLINAIPLSDSVVRNTRYARDHIQSAINNGLVLGKSGREVAADVVRFIDPNTPGGASFAAMRIGRTELNNSFHTTTIKGVADQPWVDGVKWVLSGSHPRPDECNDYAGRDHAGLGAGIYTRDRVPGKPHPQCLCYTTVVTVDPDQFADQLLSGRYDNFLRSNGFVPIQGGNELFNIQSWEQMLGNGAKHADVLRASGLDPDSREYKRLGEALRNYKGGDKSALRNFQRKYMSGERTTAKEAVRTVAKPAPKITPSPLAKPLPAPKPVTSAAAKLEKATQNYSARITNLPPKAKEMAERAIARVEKVFPNGTSRFSHIKVGGVGEDEVIAKFSTADSSITISNRFARNLKMWEREVKQEEAAGFLAPVGGRPEGQIAHEIGHSLWQYASPKTQEDVIQAVGEYLGKKSGHGDILISMNRDRVGQELSLYATTNMHEFVAESVAEYVSMDNPRPLAKLVGDILKREYG